MNAGLVVFWVKLCQRGYRFNSCCMAASNEDNDYVHLVMKELCDNVVTASYCICQVSVWESK